MTVERVQAGEGGRLEDGGLEERQQVGAQGAGGEGAEVAAFYYADVQPTHYRSTDYVRLRGQDG